MHGAFVEDFYRDESHPGEGVGPEGWGAGPIRPGMFADRGAPMRYDDTIQARPAAQVARGFQGAALQLRNGVSSLARGRLAASTPIWSSQVIPANKRVLPGDRQPIPPSVDQVQSWIAATAGAQPTSVAGNGAVIAGYPAGGGVF